MRKSIFLVVLIIAFLTIFISCTNKNNPASSNTNKENDIGENKENPLDLDREDIADNSNNDNEKDLDNNNKNNFNNIADDRFLSDIPYDKSIEYSTNINGNLANGFNVASD